MELALLITALASLISALVSIYSAHLTRKHNKNSVKPLYYMRRYAFGSKIGITLHNNGCGPMIIKKIHYIRENKISHSTPREILPQGMLEKNSL